jgi:hypothetical protein
MADPVAWKLIERGWSVLDATGNEVGKVDSITGDIGADIFDGITFGDGGTVLTRPRYVPAEHVAAIREGEVALDLDPDAVARLEPYSEPMSEPLADLAPEPEPPPGRGPMPRGGVSRLITSLFGRRW